jgi:hypothetical protein
LSGRLLPRFTPKGFKVVQTPAHIQQRLKVHLDAALADTEHLRSEDATHSSYRSENVSVAASMILCVGDADLSESCLKCGAENIRTHHVEQCW